MLSLFLFCVVIVFINGENIPILTETDHFYLIDSTLSHSEAQDFCKDTFGTTLGIVRNDLYNSELRIIFTRFDYINNIWIGNTEEVHYSNWGMELNDVRSSCIVSKSLLGNWYSHVCDSKEYFVCSKMNINEETISNLSLLRLTQRLRRTDSPTRKTFDPTFSPTTEPTDRTFSPTIRPTDRPTGNPTTLTADPTRSPLANGETFKPTSSPTVSISPTPSPTDNPTPVLNLQNINDSILTETDHFYLIDSKLSNSEAQDFCKDTFGTTLGIVKNDLYNSELRIIFTRFNYINNIWIGNTEEEHFNNWGIKPIDNNLYCIVSKSLLGNWYINNCNSKEYFICNKIQSKENSIMSKLARRLTPMSPTKRVTTPTPTFSPTPLTEVYPQAVFNTSLPIFKHNGISCGPENAISTLATGCPFGWNIEINMLLNEAFVVYEFNTNGGVSLKQFSIQNFGNNDTDVKSFILYGFESSSYTFILSGTTRPEDNTKQRFDISNTYAFAYWKIVINSTWGTNTSQIRVENFGFYQ